MKKNLQPERACSPSRTSMRGVLISIALGVLFTSCVSDGFDTGLAPNADPAGVSISDFPYDDIEDIPYAVMNRLGGKTWNWSSFKNILDDYIGPSGLTRDQYDSYVSYWNPY